MEHLVQTQTLTSIVNSIVEVSATLPPLMVTKKRLPHIRSRKSLVALWTWILLQRRRRTWGCSTSITLRLTLWVYSQKMCQTKFVQIFFARARSATTWTPRRPSKLKRETIMAIANHFTKQDIGWFNKYHFMKMPNITNEIKKLLKNTKGPNSKMAWSICCHIPMRWIHRLQNLSLIVFSCYWLAGIDPALPPKLVLPVQGNAFSFKQVLSDKLHYTLVINQSLQKRYRSSQVIWCLIIVENICIF